MTRKEALQSAITTLSADAKNKEAIRLLQDIMDELPLVHWSDKSVRDAVEQFRAERGRVPTVTDFRKAGLPSHPVMKQIYKKTLAEWLTENFPEEHPTREQLIEKRISRFIDDYHKIKPCSPRQYNEQRGEDAYRWQVIASYLDVRTWKELIARLELPIYLPPPKTRKREDFVVRIHLNLFDED